MDLEKKAKKIRNIIVDITYNSKCGHLGSSLSCVEILTYLYFSFLNFNNSNKDHFILSKGHACAALYATLFEKELIDKETLDKFNINGGLLNKHPDKNLEYGIEFSTGSLGHGLSLGAGIALGLKKDNTSNKVCVLLGDGECDEGLVWEGAMFASHFNLNNLYIFVDYNKIQALGETKKVMALEPLVDKWIAFGWEVHNINGHNFKEIEEALKPTKSKKPKVIILNTVKGKGISFLENKLKSHYVVLNQEEYLNAKRDLK
ncbi:MAG: transketolase [Candidatus Diapherotrites archaeon CG08_land_8_20_14_0_20_30_16]|nr:MAG: transketolase [Candidatus Diapherotrites archaeon CG08_land_8_20_14_0_20_30_16]